MFHWHHKKLSISHLLAIASLCAVFLGAQGFMLVHELDLDEHHHDHACETCLHSSLLGGGMAVEHGAALLFTGPDSYRPVSDQVPAQLRLPRPTARAPPIDS